MKPSTKKLSLQHEVVRQLTSIELREAAGGKPNPTVTACVTECAKTIGAC